MYRGALKSMLSELLRQDRLLLVEELSVPEPRTKQLKQKLEGLESGSLAIVVEAFDRNLWLAARNLPGVVVLEAAEVDPYSLARCERALMTVAAAKLLEERLK
jgi:large subunit ribosomal protein L4